MKKNKFKEDSSSTQNSTQKYNGITKQFLKFVCIGLINSVIDYTVFYFILFSSPGGFLFANTIAFIFAFHISFILNTLITFRDETVLRWSLAKYKRFLVIPLMVCIMTSIILFIFEPFLGAYLTKFIAILVSIPFSFILMKFFVFRKKK